MNNVAEIASAARAICSESLAQAVQKAEISVLKKNIDAQTQIQMALVGMLQDIQPNLGTQVDTNA
jgi:hypothetical protein